MCVAVLENITSFNPAYAARIPISLTKWLLTRISRKERSISQNKQYAAEILSIILQLSRHQLRSTLSLPLNPNILDILLTQLSPYRKRDPTKHNDDEEEFVENVFDALCTCVQSPLGKTMFLDPEGVELCLLFLKGEGKVAKSRGLKVLDFAVGGVGGDTIAEKLIDAGGLKILFGMFMKKVFIVQ
jgi:beta-catenin-like protein 1